MSPDPYQRYGPSRLPPRICDVCGQQAERFYPIVSGGDMMTVCGDCKGEVAGGE